MTRWEGVIAAGAKSPAGYNHGHPPPRVGTGWNAGLYIGSTGERGGGGGGGVIILYCYIGPDIHASTFSN